MFLDVFSAAEGSGPLYRHEDLPGAHSREGTRVEQNGLSRYLGNNLEEM